MIGDSPIVTTLFGIGFNGPDIMVLTFVVIFGYVAMFAFLVALFADVMYKVRGSSGFAKFLWVLFAVPLGFVTITLNIIHLVLFVWIGYTSAVSLRDWWHAGAK